MRETNDNSRGKRRTRGRAASFEDGIDAGNVDLSMSDACQRRTP